MFEETREYKNFTDVIKHCQEIIRKKCPNIKLICAECGCSNAFYRQSSDKSFCDFCWQKIESKELLKLRKSSPNNFLQYCNIPERFFNYDFSFYKTPFKYLDELKQYANLSQLYDLLLYGKAGHGKTSISICIIKELIKRGCDYSKMFYITENDYKNKLIYLQDNKKDREYFLNKIINYSFLVYDEIGNHTTSDFMVTSTKELIDNRQNNNKVSLLITNLDNQSLFKLYGSPFISRLNTFEKMVIESRDYRKTS